MIAMALEWLVGKYRLAIVSPKTRTEYSLS